MPDILRFLAVSVAVLPIWAIGAFGPAGAAELLFYSSVPRNLTEPLNKAFQERNPGVKVTMFQAGTETLLEKMELEIQGKGKPEADVVWIQEVTAMQRYAQKGLLVPHVPPEADKIPQMYRDKNGHFYGTFVTHAVFMYNTKALNDETAPKSWTSLLESRFRDKTVFADPRISGTGSAVATAIVQNFGWNYWEKMAANRPMIAAGHPAMVSTIIAGERTAGPMLDYSIVAAIAKGQPIAFVFPREGAISVAAYVGIIKGTKALVDAQRFVNFFVSKDAANILQSMGMYHSRVDAQPPKGWPPISDIKILPINWDEHKEKKDEIKKKFGDLLER